MSVRRQLDADWVIMIELQIWIKQTQMLMKNLADRLKMQQKLSCLGFVPIIDTLSTSVSNTQTNI